MNQRGMSLVELLVVLVLASIVGIFVMTLFITSNRTFMDQNKILDAQRDGRLVMEYLTRYLREAGLDPHNTRDSDNKPLFRGIRGIIPVLPVDPAAPHAVLKIWFDRNSNFDESFDNDEMVELAFNPGTGIIKRTFSDVNGTLLRSQDIAKNVFLFEVESFDATGVSSPANPEDTRTIELSISFKDTKHRGGDFTRTYSTRVELRNL